MVDHESATATVFASFEILFQSPTGFYTSSHCDFRNSDQVNRLREINAKLGRSFDLGTHVESEAATIGLAGQVSHDAAVVCGGQTGDGKQVTRLEQPRVSLVILLEPRYFPSLQG